MTLLSHPPELQRHQATKTWRGEVITTWIYARKRRAVSPLPQFFSLSLQRRDPPARCAVGSPSLGWITLFWMQLGCCCRDTTVNKPPRISNCSCQGCLLARPSSQHAKKKKRKWVTQKLFVVHEATTVNYCWLVTATLCCVEGRAAPIPLIHNSAGCRGHTKCLRPITTHTVLEEMCDWFFFFDLKLSIKAIVFALRQTTLLFVCFFSLAI